MKYTIKVICDICGREVQIFILEASLGIFGGITRNFEETLCPFETICKKCKQEKTK